MNPVFFYQVTELSGILEDERESGHGKAAILQEEQVLRISAEKEIESLKVKSAQNSLSQLDHRPFLI